MLVVVFTAIERQGTGQQPWAKSSEEWEFHGSRAVDGCIRSAVSWRTDSKRISAAVKFRVGIGNVIYLGNGLSFLNTNTMSTTPDYIAFVMDALDGIQGMEFRHKKMFGEYCVYANEKPILLVCDNTVYAKMLPCLESLLGGAPQASPYEGAKLHYQLDVEDAALMGKVIPLLEANTPLPKPRKKKG